MPVDQLIDSSGMTGLVEHPSSSVVEFYKPGSRSFLPVARTLISFDTNRPQYGRHCGDLICYRLVNRVKCGGHEQEIVSTVSAAMAEPLRSNKQSEYMNRFCSIGHDPDKNKHWYLKQPFLSQQLKREYQDE